ncbi:hypothetical protein COP1_022401 [Malus domestica]
MGKMDCESLPNVFNSFATNNEGKDFLGKDGGELGNSELVILNPKFMNEIHNFSDELILISRNIKEGKKGMIILNPKFMNEIHNFSDELILISRNIKEGKKGMISANHKFP